MPDKLLNLRSAKRNVRLRTEITRNMRKSGHGLECLRNSTYNLRKKWQATNRNNKKYEKKRSRPRVSEEFHVQPESGQFDSSHSSRQITLLCYSRFHRLGDKPCAIYYEVRVPYMNVTRWLWMFRLPLNDSCLRSGRFPNSRNYRNWGTAQCEMYRAVFPILCEIAAR